MRAGSSAVCELSRRCRSIAEWAWARPAIQLASASGAGCRGTSRGHGLNHIWDRYIEEGTSSLLIRTVIKPWPSLSVAMCSIPMALPISYTWFKLADPNSWSKSVHQARPSFCLDDFWPWGVIFDSCTVVMAWKARIKWTATIFARLDRIKNEFVTKFVSNTNVGLG
jgi:hypothetical protein